MLDKILQLLFPKEVITIPVDHMPVTLNYYKRMARLQPEEVESEAYGPYPMMFVADSERNPGRYVGNGKRVTWTIH